MLADPLAYPLVLAAVYAGICVVDESTPGRQLAFALFSALAVFARIQYVVVPVAVVGAELVADRGRVARLVAAALARARRCSSSRPRCCSPRSGSIACSACTRTATTLSIRARCCTGSGARLMLLAYAGGWVIVPGALAGLAIALVRPRTSRGARVRRHDAAARRRAAARGRADRRHRLAALPGALPLHARAAARGGVRPLRQARAARSHPGRPALGGAAAARRTRSALRVRGRAQQGRLADALGGPAASRGSSPSATARSPSRLIAAVLSGVAALAAFRKLPPAVAVVAAIAACCALSAGASSFDHRSSRSLRHSLPPTCAGSTTRDLGASICSRRPARARSSRGSSCSGTRP